MRKLFNSILSFFIRISAFIAKEFYSAINQPRLVAVLILGPFLILFIFGISYENVYRTLRTAIVVADEENMEASVRAFAEQPPAEIEIVNITTSEPEAIFALKTRQLDLVMIVPPNAAELIKNNQHATFTFYHQEIDPFEISYVEIVAARLTEETNRKLLVSSVDQSKEIAQTYQSEIKQLSAIQELGAEENPGNFEEELASSPELLWFLFQAVGLQTQENNRDNTTESSFDPNNVPDLDAAQINRIDSQLTQFVDMDSQVIAEPFRRETHSLSEEHIRAVHFYVPAVLALLLQHIAVSLAGLSIVSERYVGTMELMRASPANAFEVLLGKYLSFILFLGILMGLLTALIHLVLGVPMIGSWALYTLASFLIILVSLGFGFLISNFVRSDSQAVQYSMVLLLASIFFSGFFLQLYQLKWPAQIISWMLPATYGVKMFQDIMLRGIQPQVWLFWVSGSLAIVLFIVNWIRLHRLMVQRS